MTDHMSLRRPATVLCIGLLAAFFAGPGYAQVGQSDVIMPGGTEDTTLQQGSSGYMPQSQLQPAWSNGVNPGKGWMPAAGSSSSMLTPGSRFHQKPAAAPGSYQQMTPVMAPTAAQDDMQDVGDNMGWSSVPKARSAAASRPMQQQMPQSGFPGSAFQASGTQRSSDFELPPAAEEAPVEEQPAWAAPMQQQIQRQMAPVVPKTAVAKPKVPVKPGMAAAKTPQQLNGRVMQQASQPQQGFPDMPMDMNNFGAMGGNGMNNMGNMNDMGAMNGMNNMGGGAMGGMGGGGGAMDMLGKAIAGAAQMGLIPGAKSTQGMPNVPAGTNYNPGGMAFPSGGNPMGGFSTGVSQTRMRQPSLGQQFTRTINKVPGVQTGKQIGRQVNNAAQRNVNYAINVGARRGIHSLLNRL